VVGQPDAVGDSVEGVADRVHGRLAARAHRDALGIDALSRSSQSLHTLR